MPFAKMESRRPRENLEDRRSNGMRGHVWTRAGTALVLVGRQFSGKSTFAKMISSHTGLPVVEIGQTARSIAAETGHSILHLTDRVFESDDTVVFVRRALENSPGYDRCVVVGPRFLSEVEYLKQHFHNMCTVGISAQHQIRFRRWQKTPGGHDIIKTEADWNRREQLETKWGMDGIVANCDSRVLNFDLDKVLVG